MSAVVAFPLVFHLESARFFADQIFSSHYEHLPDDAACAKVGEWSWCWMEPMIGTASFSILCLQVLHTQIKDLGLKPIDDRMRSKRAPASVPNCPDGPAASLESGAHTHPRTT